MPNGNCIEITFPETSTVAIPTGTSVSFPQAPPLSLSEGVTVTFPPETGITFPPGSVVVATIPGRPPIQIDPNEGTVTIASGQPIPIAELSQIGLAVSFPPQTTVSLPGQQPMVALPGHIKVRLRRIRDILTPHRTDL